MDKKEFEKSLAIKTNVLYCLADMLESQLMDIEDGLRRTGHALRQESKRSYNTTLRGIRGIKLDVSGISAESQREFGDDADMLSALLLTIFDRCGDDRALLYRFYEYIESFPSKLDMDLSGYDGAFDVLFNHQTGNEDEKRHSATT